MELTKKTTILLSPDLHKRLAQLAKQGGDSLGELIRRACEVQYGLVAVEERLAAVEKLKELSLPASTPARMKKESIPEPEDLV
ncbi:MAG TPA: CopG family transcriptional regulator [Acidobacteriota bacterium]|jgi:predicted DNA-binding protein